MYYFAFSVNNIVNINYIVINYIVDKLSKGDKMTVQYVDATHLKRMNRDAILQKRNRTIEPKVLDAIIKAHGDINTKFPIVFSMIHNDREIRMELSTGVEGLPNMTVDCDLKFERFIKSMDINA